MSDYTNSNKIFTCSFKKYVFSEDLPLPGAPKMIVIICFSSYFSKFT